MRTAHQPNSPVAILLLPWQHPITRADWVSSNRRIANCVLESIGCFVSVSFYAVCVFVSARQRKQQPESRSLRLGRSGATKMAAAPGGIVQWCENSSVCVILQKHFVTSGDKDFSLQLRDCFRQGTLKMYRI